VRASPGLCAASVCVASPKAYHEGETAGRDHGGPAAHGLCAGACAVPHGSVRPEKASSRMRGPVRGNSRHAFTAMRGASQRV